MRPLYTTSQNREEQTSILCSWQVGVRSGVDILSGSFVRPSVVQDIPKTFSPMRNWG